MAEFNKFELPNIEDIPVGLPVGQHDVEWHSWQDLQEHRDHLGMPIVIGLPTTDDAVEEVFAGTDFTYKKFLKYMFNVDPQYGDYFIDNRLAPLNPQLGAIAVVGIQLNQAFAIAELHPESVGSLRNLPWHVDRKDRASSLGLIVSPLNSVESEVREAAATRFAINKSATEKYSDDPRLIGEHATDSRNQGIVDENDLEIWKNVAGYPMVLTGRSLHSRLALPARLTRRSLRLV